MKNITPFNNTPTIVHVNELPSMATGTLSFGFAPGKLGDVPTVRINVKLLGNLPNGNQVHLATYESNYKIEGEGKILESHIYDCVQQAIHAMRIFLEFDEIGRSIPREYTLCPGKEDFEADLIDVAKAMNAIGGKGKFPPRKS